MKKEKFNGLNFSSLEKLTRDEQKKVVGGYGSIGSGMCTIEITCNASKKISCSSNSGKCKASGANEVPGWVQCDNDAKINC